MYQLNNYATPNSLTVQIPEVNPEHSDEAGTLWIRYLCSPKGGTVHFENEHFNETLDTTCGPVSRLEWVTYPTVAGFDKELSFTNKTGINAINAITWLSNTDLQILQSNSQRAIDDKQLLHLQIRSIQKGASLLKVNRFNLVKSVARWLWTQWNH